MAEPKKTGTWFNSQKGYGFITPSEEGGEDLFVHQTVIHAEGFRSLRENEAVEYDVDKNDGRAKAINVTGPGGAHVLGAQRREHYNAGGRGGYAGGAPGAPGGGRGRGRGGRGGRGGAPRSTACYTCGQEGHIARDCTSAPAAPQ